MIQQEFDDMYHDQESHHYYDQDAITVTQHLTPEQYLYEFPTKDCLETLSYLDNDTQDSFFDIYSFVSSSAAFSSAYYECYSVMDHETLLEEDEWVDDGRLSPLQLPVQLVQSSRPIESHHDNISPVGPSSFLAGGQLCDHVTQTEIESLDFDSSDSIISSSIRTTESRIVLVKLNRSQKQSAITFIKIRQADSSYSDEGYDDTTEHDEELESNCIFYPIQEEEEDEQTKAATKIQSVWRGYCSRKEQSKSKLKPDQHLMLQFMQFSNRLHHRQMQAMQDRLAQLEQKVRQEEAMRKAFEKAMENTVVMMDQQQKIMYDRLEQEVHLRHVYEAKVKTTLDQIEPLESRLRKETNARLRLEEMMTRVLDQMHASEESRKKQIQQDEASTCQLQAKLDRALEELEQLKRKDTNLVSKTRPSNIPNNPSRRQPRTTPTKHSLIERPSIVPSIRRSTVQQKSSTTNRRK